MISGPVVVDASVVVEHLVTLRFTESASALFRGLVTDPELELFAPDLVYPECASALRKLVAIRAIPEAAGARAVAHLLELPLVITPTARLVSDAWKLRDSLTIYDACYAVLAQKLGAALITADEKLAKALRTARGRVLSLAELT